LIFGVDLGDSHICLGFINPSDGTVLEKFFCKMEIETLATNSKIIIELRMVYQI
jgi:hypothetical protein